MRPQVLIWLYSHRRPIPATSKPLPHQFTPGTRFDFGIFDHFYSFQFDSFGCIVQYSLFSNFDVIKACSGKRSEICWAIGCGIHLFPSSLFSVYSFSYLLHKCLCSLLFLSLLMPLRPQTNRNYFLFCFPSSFMVPNSNGGWTIFVSFCSLLHSYSKTNNSLKTHIRLLFCGGWTVASVRLLMTTLQPTVHSFVTAGPFSCRLLDIFDSFPLYLWRIIVHFHP
jgi:hypothetical protein